MLLVQTIHLTATSTSGSFLSMHNRCGDNNGAGYGLNQLVLNWSFNAAPTITFQPTDASLWVVHHEVHAKT
jgi:hypothetical protein